jgi:CRP-like cAMP-binding protein
VTTPKSARPENLLLASLPAADRRLLMASGEPVDLAPAQLLARSGEPVRHVFFPINSFVSLATPFGVGTNVELGLIGNEGMLGASLLLGVQTSPLRATVQGSGQAWKLDGRTFTRALRSSPALRRELGRYVYVLMSQLALAAACSHFHLVEARLARWLLMTRDRAHSSKFHITHDALAYMLSVRREGVTQAAGALQRRGIIRYSRGDIEIVSPRRLEAAACGCYGIALGMYARAFR